MGQAPSLKDESHSESVRERSRILFFRAWVCLQLGITSIVVVLLLNIFNLRRLYAYLPVQLGGIIFGALVLFVFVCPLLALSLLFRMSFGRTYKSVWFVIVIALFVFHLLFFSGYLTAL